MAQEPEHPAETPAAPYDGGCCVRILLGFIITAAAIVGIITLVVIGLTIEDRKPVTVDTQTNGAYCVRLIAVGSPDWPFGSQNGLVILERDGSKIAEQYFTLSNDGKNMGADNWRVSWWEDGVLVTISGEEQPDEQLMLYYAGGHKERSRS